MMLSHRRLSPPIMYTISGSIQRGPLNIGTGVLLGNEVQDIGWTVGEVLSSTLGRAHIGNLTISHEAYVEVIPETRMTGGKSGW